MSIDTQFELRFLELTKLIQDKPLVKKPQLGELLEDSPNKALKADVEQALVELKTREKHIAQKKSIIQNYRGIDLFTDIVYNIISEIDQLVESYRNNYQFSFHVKKNVTDRYLLSTVNFTGQFTASQVYSNTAEEAHITLRLFRGPYGLDYGIDYDEPIEEIYHQTYKFDLDEKMDVIFVKADSPAIKIKPVDIPTILVRDVITREIKLKQQRLE